MERPASTPGRVMAAVNRRRLARGERGAALIEFAIILPVLAMLILGLISGALAWDRKQSLTHAGREAVRYGATLPTGSDLNAWLDTVANVAVSNANGNLDPSTPGRYLCVALISAGGNNRRVVTGSGAAVYDSGACFSDGLVGTRVQVVAKRQSDLDAFLHFSTLTLTGSSSARFEAAP